MANETQTNFWEQEVKFFENHIANLKKNRKTVPHNARNGLKFAKDCLKEARQRGN